MSPSPELPIAELTPRAVSKWRGLGFALGGMGVVIGGVVLAIAVSNSPPQPSSMASAGHALEHRATSAGAEEASPKYNQQVAQENHRRVVQAATTGQSFVAIPVGKVELTQPIAPAEQPVSSGSQLSRQPPAQVQLPAPPGGPGYRATSFATPSGAREEDLRTAMGQYLSTLDKAWRASGSVRQVVQSDAPSAVPAPPLPAASPHAAQESSAAGTTNPEPAPTTVHVGDVLYASNEYELNSDIGSRAEARVLSGALRGSKLFGQFKLTGDYLVIEYSQLVLTDGTVLTVQAVAEDPVAERLFVRSSIDHHMVERWGGLLAGTYLATYGQKLEQSGATTVVTTGAGGTTSVSEQPQYTARQINEIALGRVGGEVANQVRSQLSRPPTVTLKAKAELGLRILAAPTRAQQLRQIQQSG